MSITCTKTLPLHVEAGSTVERVVYYKCEEPSSGSPAPTLLDSVSGLNLVPQRTVGGGIITSVAGIIGNGFDFPTGGFPNSWEAKYGPTAAFNFTGDSFTIRFWHNPLAGATNYIISTIANLWGVKLEANKYVFRANLTTGIVAATSLAVGAGWHRVIAWHEHGVGVGIKVDDDASITTAGTGALTSGNVSVYIGDASGFLTDSYYFDEFGLWTGLWSDAQKLSDWNGGAGKTFPDIP